MTQQGSESDMRNLEPQVHRRRLVVDGCPPQVVDAADVVGGPVELR